MTSTANKTYSLFLLLFLLWGLEGCEWRDPTLKTLKTCAFPTDINITADVADPRKFIFSIPTTAPNDIRSITWKVLSGTTILVQSTLTANQSYVYTASINGNYTVNAEIETVCGEKKILSKTIAVKTCVQPSSIATLSLSNGTYTFGLITATPADVRTVTWKVINNGTTLVQEQRTDANAYNYTFTSSGNYSVNADVETICGERITLSLVVVVTVQAIATNANFKAWKLGGSGNDIGNKIALDGLGNVYVIGTYSSTISFNTTTLNVAGAKDIFISKYNSNGDPAWVQRITGDGNDEAKDIVVDNNGDIFVTGEVSTNAGFFNTPADVRSGSITRKTTNGTSDVFVVKYSKDGALQWSKIYGGGSSEQGTSIALHTTGIYITGVFGATTTVFGTITLQALGTLGKNDIFVAKLNYSGDVIWAVSGGGFENDFASSIAVDSDGNAYITGNFSSPATFRSYSGASAMYSSNATPDIFIAKYNTNGNLVAFHNSNAGTPVYGSSIVIRSGALYTAGTIGGGKYGSFTLDYRGGGGDIFLAKYNLNSLNVDWVKTAGSAGFDGANELVLDNSGNIYVTGLFSDNCQFGTIAAKSVGDTDAFMAQYDLNDNFRFVKTAGSTGPDGSNSIAVNSTGNLLFMTGFYTGAFVSGSSALLYPSGGLDAFVLKYPD